MASREQFARQIMSGAARGVGPAMLRAGLSIVEPFYAAAMWTRNKMFDAHLRAQHRLDRPVISVGNITTGGTGKTPVVQWIVPQLLAMNHRPAILLRGYKSGGDHEGKSDEAELLSRSLNIPVRADPDRFAVGRSLLESQPEIDVIVLDDGFQHRRVARDFDLVLIDATNPFGYGHVLPRGMLREPLAGLRRATALMITRADQVNPETLTQIEQTLRRYNSAAPIFRANHAIVRFACGDETFPPEALRDKKIFTFCGIGNPTNFHRQLLDMGALDAGMRTFDDHHAYSVDDILSINDQAIPRGDQIWVTTEKDWVKIEPLAANAKLPIWRAQLEVQLPPDQATKLREMIELIMKRPSPTSSSAK